MAITDKIAGAEVGASVVAKVPQVSKEVLDYQQTLKDLATNRRNPTVRGELLTNERKLATQIAKNPDMLEQARSLGVEKQVRESAALAAKQAQGLSQAAARGRGL
tara:strand:+ start:3104 stop:3418 length:315 start_codon:yes stop_codon:yes gene_type:complete